MGDIIDKYLDQLVQRGFNKYPIEIELEMSDPNQDTNEEWRRWVPIKSTVTDEEIGQFEDQIGYKLPESYNRFLKHKHFYELMISQCTFCFHPINKWKTNLLEMIFDGYPREYLIDTGRILFANWSDWGLLCFDTNIKIDNYDYPVVLWDHEQSNHFEPEYDNFEEMIKELDKQEEKNAS